MTRPNEWNFVVILTYLTFVGPVLGGLAIVVVLISCLLRAEEEIVWPIVPKLLLDALHVVDLVGACICSRPYRLIILDAEVDARDGVLAW